MIPIDKNLHHSQQTMLFSKLKSLSQNNKTQGSVDAMRLNSLHLKKKESFSSVLHQTTAFI